MTTPSVITQTWQLTLIKMFRSILQDVDSQNENYQDEALRDILITAAKMVSGDLGLNSTYVIVLEATTISPDPVDAGDDAFINLILLKAQLSLVTGEWRKSVKKSVQIQMGPRVSINTSVAANVYSGLAKELRDQYNQELAKYKFNNSNPAVVIMSGSPVGPDYDADGELLPINGWLTH